MSIFGMLDAENIPTNPFYVEAGEYSAEITKAGYKQNRDGQRQISITYTINEEASEYNNQPVTQFFNLVSEDMTMEMLQLLPPDEKQAIRKANAALKRTLCGNDSNSKQKGLGVSADDLNDPNWNPETLVGTKVDLCVSNYGETNEGVNIRWVNIQE